MKKTWGNVMGAARMMVTRIENTKGKEWEYFNNDASLDPLRTAIKEADKVAYESEFVQEYLSCGVHKEILERLGEAQMVNKCMEMVLSMEELLNTVAKETSRLATMKLEARSPFEPWPAYTI